MRVEEAYEEEIIGIRKRSSFEFWSDEEPRDRSNHFHCQLLKRHAGNE